MSPNRYPPQLIPTLLLTIILFYIPSPVRGGRKIINYKPVEMTRSETISYFTSILQHKASSFDRLNEEVFSTDVYAEDLYHRIDDLMPRPEFLKLLLRTKNITDKLESHGESMLPFYAGAINTACHRDSVWNHTLTEILKVWDGDRSIIANDLEQYHKRNIRTPHEKLCNRFKGLTCQYIRSPNPQHDYGRLQIPSETPFCQCTGDSKDVAFYPKKEQPGKRFPEGCYIRPWRPCRHLTIDNLFRQSYSEWHTNLASQRKQLAQMVFPVARPHRCAEGSYCTDMIPGMKTPVCWCTKDSKNPKCQSNEENPEVKKRVPALGGNLNDIRRDFVKLFINYRDPNAKCYPELNARIEMLVNVSGMDPTLTGAPKLMQALVQYADDQKTKTGANVRICDFRRGLFCDKVLGKCRGKEACEPGKIHLGKGVCVVNNAHSCQTTEECVENAKCRMIKGTTESVCQCESGYGDRCALHNPAFFSRLFVPITSGFRDDEYVQQQVKISKVLEAWEDNMFRKADETCDPSVDESSMSIVKYFGNLREYNPERGDALLTVAKEIDQDSPKLCTYTKFLRCSSRIGKCVPLYGKRVISMSGPVTDNDWGSTHVESDVEGVCGGMVMPLIFRDLVVFHCPKGYICRDSNEGYDSCQPDCESLFAPAEACRQERAAVAGKGKSKVGEDGGWNVLSGRTSVDNNEPASLRQLRIQGRQSQSSTSTLPTSAATTTTISPLPSSSSDSIGESKSTTVITTTLDSSKVSSTTTDPTTTFPPDVLVTNAMNVSSTEPYEPPVTSPPAPPRKAAYEEYCEYDDSNEGFSEAEFSVICNSTNFLVCQGQNCACNPGLRFNWKELKCMIPLGARCDEQSVNLPPFMKYSELLCDHGACIQDNGRQICRPETDKFLIIVEYKQSSL